MHRKLFLPISVEDDIKVIEQFENLSIDETIEQTIKNFLINNPKFINKFDNGGLFLKESCEDIELICQKKAEFGAKQSTFIDCPANGQILKIISINEMIKFDKDPEIILTNFFNLQKIHMNINDMNDKHFVKTIDSWYCIPKQKINNKTIDESDIKNLKYYVIQEKVVGTILSEFIKYNPNKNDIINIINQGLCALNSLHKNNIYHNDTHGKNVIILNDMTPVFIDYGLSTIDSKRDKSYKTINDNSKYPYQDMCQFIGQFDIDFIDEPFPNLCSIFNNVRAGISVKNIKLIDNLIESCSVMSAGTKNKSKSKRKKSKSKKRLTKTKSKSKKIKQKKNKK